MRGPGDSSQELRPRDPEVGSSWPSRGRRMPACNQCWSEDVRPSRLHGPADHLAVVVFPVQPYRCRDCGARSWKLEVTGAYLLRTALIVSIAVAVFVVAKLAG